jgi:hypothetical protein
MEVPATFLGDFASAIPAGVVRLGNFPERIRLPVLAVGQTLDGEPGAPTILDSRPCRSGENAASDPCMDIDMAGMDIMAAALRFVGALTRATGDYPFSYTYGNTQNFSPGGWGGGKNFVGADFGGIFLHEMGHALSLPHWGQGSYGRENPGDSEYRYPYGGLGDDGGGRGESYNYYQNIDEFVSPSCLDPAKEGDPVFGQERSDAMQRNEHCTEYPRLVLKYSASHFLRGIMSGHYRGPGEEHQEVLLRLTYH